MKQLKHWQDPVNGLLGAWLIVSPWVLDIQQPRVAMATLIIAGVVLLGAAIGAVLLPAAWEEWLEVVVGAALVASPWVLGFASHPAATQVALLTGLATLVLAFWVLAVDKDYGAWWSRLVG